MGRLCRWLGLSRCRRRRELVGWRTRWCRGPARRAGRLRCGSRPGGCARLRPGRGRRGANLLHVDAAVLPGSQSPLYAELDRTPARAIDLQFVPYGLWANRGHGEMTVWLPLIRTLERKVV
ncbi:hypothetical protein ACXC9Q_17845 [Kribbella sp. CWNU-51]